MDARGETSAIAYNNFISTQFNLITLSKIKNNITPYTKKKVIAKEKKYRHVVGNLVIECLDQINKYKAKLTQKIINMCALTFFEINSNILLIDCFDTHIYKFLVKESHLQKITRARAKLDQIEYIIQRLSVILDVLHSLPDCSDSLVSFNFGKLITEHQNNTTSSEIKAIDAKIADFKQKISEENTIYSQIIQFYLSSDVNELSFNDIISFCRNSSQSSQEYCLLFDELISFAWQQKEYPFTTTKFTNLDKLRETTIADFIVGETDKTQIKNITESWKYYPVVQKIEELGFEISPRNMINILWDACSMIPKLINKSDAEFDQIFPIFAAAFSTAALSSRENLLSYIYDFANQSLGSPQASFIATYIETLNCLAKQY